MGYAGADDADVNAGVWEEWCLPLRRDDNGGAVGAARMFCADEK